jgi:mannosyltransferase OCH1-like enzyme
MFKNPQKQKIQDRKILEHKIYKNKVQHKKAQKHKIVKKHTIEQQKISQDKISELLNQINIYNSFKKLLIPFKMKSTYNSIIPLNLYMCWHTKDLPPKMKENYEFLVKSNPEITFHFYDDNDCREFIKDNFEDDVLNAFDKLIPGAYKADLWRYCILYINGGIYLDIKYRCVNGFKFIALTEEEHFVRDRPDNCVYTALIVTLPQNEIMKKCIYQIVENVKNKFYGENSISPTGPGLLGKYFTNEKIKQLEMYFKDSFIENKLDEFYVVNNDKIILTYYSGYRIEQLNFQKNKYYGILWDEKSIYL